MINNLFAAIETLIPIYMSNPTDANIAKGNVAVCLIEENGQVHGKMYGTDKSRMRQCFKIAWIKASQVWLTGVKTGEYERMVFTGEVEENANGIENPDLIGWEGGQPITLEDGTKLAVGFSGFRGVIDVEIVERAVAEMRKRSAS